MLVRHTRKIQPNHPRYLSPLPSPCRDCASLSAYVVVAPPPSVRPLLRVALSPLHFPTLLGERLFSLKRRPRHLQPSDRSLPHVPSRPFCVAVKLSFSYMPMPDSRLSSLVMLALHVRARQIINWNVILLYIRRPSEPNKTRARYLDPRVCALFQVPLALSHRLNNITRNITCMYSLYVLKGL